MTVRKLISSAVLAILLCPAALTAAPADADIVTLFQLIDARLAHMQAVAAYKWNNDIAIEDLQRESEVLLNTAKQAEQFGLAEESSILFFKNQIAAAKSIQKRWFQAWSVKSEPFPDFVPDLASQIRPQLSQLGDQIISQIALALIQLQSEPQADLTAAFNATLATRFLDESVKGQLLEALRQIRFDERIRKHSTRLQQITTTGKLVVGTTGDYPPFSYLDPAGSRFVGIDIDLARDLAASLNAEPVFQQTSWPSLIRDLSDGRFDIAMSGISRNLQRQKVGFFSRPYHRGGKTPISRCDQVTRFDSLAKIDLPGVRVIVNPGGTNQKYVQSNIHDARIIVYDDNRTIFNEIANGHADVMITDAIEVRLQSHRFTELCPSTPNSTLTQLQKAYLMPQDIHLKGYVDNWLKRIDAQGKLAEIFSNHLQ